MKRSLFSIALMATALIAANAAFADGTTSSPADAATDDLAFNPAK